MPDFDLFDLTGLPFDGIEAAPKVKAALDKLKKELQSQQGRTTQDAETHELSAKLAFISKMESELFTPDGKKLTPKMTELADARKKEATDIIEAGISRIERRGEEKLVTSALIRAQRKDTKLKVPTIEAIYKAHGFQIVSTDPTDHFPKFPSNMDAMDKDLSLLRQTPDPAPNAPDTGKILDLYDFAAYISADHGGGAAYRGLPTPKLCQLFSDYQIANIMRTDPLGSVCKRLASNAKTYVFDGDEHRKGYDDYLLFTGREMSTLKREICAFPREQRAEANFYESYLDDITRIFGDQDVALSVYNKVADVTVELMTPKYRVKCASCHALSTFSTPAAAQRANKCATCGEPLYRKCPKCGTMVLLLSDRCPRPNCGYVFASAGLFDQYFREAEAAFRRGDLKAAWDQLGMAESADPGEKTRSTALRQKLEAEEKRYREPLQRLDLLMKQNKFQEAAGYIATIAKQYPSLNVSAQVAQIRSVLSACQQRLDAAGSNKTARINACLDALDSCADYAPALDFLHSAAATPAPCSAIDYSTDDEKGSITLTWRGSAERGVRYMLLRKEGAVPKDRSDGRVLVRDSGELMYTDSGVEPGATYGYAVFAERMGVYSAPCSCRAVVYNRVTALRCEQKGTSVFLTWAAPAQSSGVEVIRTAAGSSQRLVPQSRGSLQDRDLPFNTPLSYSVCALYPDGGRSARRQASITLTPEVKNFSISASRMANGSYQISWSIREQGIDLQILSNGKLLTSARSGSNGAVISLPPNGSYTISVQALSSGSWTPSENTLTINTYSACELDPAGCSLTETRSRQAGRELDQIHFELKLRGELLPAVKRLLLFVRTKSPGANNAPWVTPEDASRAEDGISIDADAYRRAGAINFSFPAKDEDCYYLTLYTVYQANGREIVSGPARRRFSRPLVANLFWKVTKSWRAGLQLILDLEPNRPVTRRPALVLCASQTGRTPLSPADPNAIRLAEIPDKQLDTPQARLHEELPLAGIARNTRLFLFEKEPAEGEHHILRWASGFDGKV